MFWMEKKTHIVLRRAVSRRLPGRIETVAKGKAFRLPLSGGERSLENGPFLRPFAPPCTPRTWAQSGSKISQSRRPTMGWASSLRFDGQKHCPPCSLSPKQAPPGMVSGASMMVASSHINDACKSLVIGSNCGSYVGWISSPALVTINDGSTMIGSWPFAPSKAERLQALPAAEERQKEAERQRIKGNEMFLGAGKRCWWWIPFRIYGHP